MSASRRRWNRAGRRSPKNVTSWGQDGRCEQWQARPDVKTVLCDDRVQRQLTAEALWEQQPREPHTRAHTWLDKAAAAVAGGHLERVTKDGCLDCVDATGLLAVDAVRT
jgi:hypothetical protein